MRAGIEPRVRGPFQAKARACAAAAGVFFVYVLAVVALQVAGGAYGAEIGREVDDASHYITGLMIRDYVAAGMPSPPLEFAKQYYLHYPRVAFGHWPPLFYVIEAVWMLLISHSTASMLVMMACWTAASAAAVSWPVGSVFGRWFGFAAGLLLICVPIVQRLAATVMLDTPVAVLSVCAVLLFARYLESDDWRYSAYFGIVASLALLTHGTAIALALVPPVAAVLERKPRLFLRAGFWVSAGIALALSGPWYWLAPGARHEYVLQRGGATFTPRKANVTWLESAEVLGACLLALAVLGFVFRVLIPAIRRKPAGPLWSCAGAMIVSFFALRVFIHQAAGSRHLTLLLPAVILFAAEGIARVASWVPAARLTLWQKQAAVGAVAAAAFGLQAFTIPQAEAAVFADVVGDLLRRPEWRNAAVLIAADTAEREGQFITSIAEREDRPGRFVLRASKSLASMGLLGSGYRMRHGSPEVTMHYLESVPVRVVVLDACRAEPQWAHQRALEAALDQYAHRWKLEGTYPCGSVGAAPGRRIRVFSLLGAFEEGRPDVRVDMRDRLGEVLRNQRP